MAFIKVTKSRPCEVCGKPDWCMYTPDGELAICPRISNGSLELKKSGYLHRLTSGPPGRRRQFKRPVVPCGPKIDARAMAMEFCQNISDAQIIKLADILGLSLKSLRLLRIGWCREQKAFTFPMRNGKRQIIGIRTRHENGAHRAIRGSRSGLFIPYDFRRQKLFICEGPSDTAMMLTLGIPAIGRPSCMGGVDQIVKLLKFYRILSVTIVTDNDGPGRAGAVHLLKTLGFGEIVSPPPAFNDVREAGRAIIARIENLYEAQHERC